MEASWPTVYLVCFGGHASTLCLSVKAHLGCLWCFSDYVLPKRSVKMSPLQEQGGMITLTQRAQQRMQVFNALERRALLRSEQKTRQ
jgi:hypothetical protein